MIFMVWNDDCGDEEDAEEILAFDVEVAAQKFAEADNDGRQEGSYDESNRCVLCVRNTENGELSKVSIYVSYEPTFHTRVK